MLSFVPLDKKSIAIALKSKEDLCFRLFHIQGESIMLPIHNEVMSSHSCTGYSCSPKYMSTKWPLAPMIMKSCKQCRSRNLELHLSWQRRNFNTEADSLTNGDFSALQIQNQVHFDFPNIPWLVLTDALEVYDLTQNLKATRNAEGYVPQHTWKRRKLAANKRLKATDPW